jgi:hypothetical protein
METPLGKTSPLEGASPPTCLELPLQGPCSVDRSTPLDESVIHVNLLSACRAIGRNNSSRSRTGARPDPGHGRWKSCRSCLPVTDQNARAPTVAEVSERRQPAHGGAASPTTRPRDPTTSPEPPRPENFPPQHPLETLVSAPSRPYKKAPSTPQNTTPPQLPIPTFLSSSLPRKPPKLCKP